MARSETEALGNLIHLSPASSAVSKVAYAAAWTRFILETANYKEADETKCHELVKLIEIPSIVDEMVGGKTKKPPISGPNACGPVIRSLIHASQIHFACGMSAAQTNSRNTANQHADAIEGLANAAEATGCNPYTKMTLSASALQIRAVVAKFR